jgi:hypothetical protein
MESGEGTAKGGRSGEKTAPSNKVRTRPPHPPSKPSCHSAKDFPGALAAFLHAPGSGVGTHLTALSPAWWVRFAPLRNDVELCRSGGDRGRPGSVAWRPVVARWQVPLGACQTGPARPAASGSDANVCALVTSGNRLPAREREGTGDRQRVRTWPWMERGPRRMSELKTSALGRARGLRRAQRSVALGAGRATSASRKGQFWSSP